MNCVACETRNIISEETQQHIYHCKLLDIIESETEFKDIFKNHYSTEKVKKIVTNFRNNMTQRETIIQNINETKSHRISE